MKETPTEIAGIQSLNSVLEVGTLTTPPCMASYKPPSHGGHTVGESGALGINYF